MTLTMIIAIIAAMLLGVFCALCLYSIFKNQKDNEKNENRMKGIENKLSSMTDLIDSKTDMLESKINEQPIYNVYSDMIDVNPSYPYDTPAVGMESDIYLNDLIDDDFEDILTDDAEKTNTGGSIEDDEVLSAFMDSFKAFEKEVLGGGIPEMNRSERPDMEMSPQAAEPAPAKAEFKVPVEPEVRTRETRIEPAARMPETPVEPAARMQETPVERAQGMWGIPAEPAVGMQEKPVLKIPVEPVVEVSVERPVEVSVRPQVMVSETPSAQRQIEVPIDVPAEQEREIPLAKPAGAPIDRPIEMKIEKTAAVQEKPEDPAEKEAALEAALKEVRAKARESVQETVKEASVSNPFKHHEGHDVGRSGKKYTASELEMLIRE